MDLKHDMMYRDDVLLVKTEPRLPSPGGSTLLPNVSNVLTTTLSNGVASNGLVSTSVIFDERHIKNDVSDQVTTLAGASNGLGAPNGTHFGATPGPGSKRPRPDDWLSSPSPGNVSVNGPPLTPSPGPQSYTVISNGYSSPMSSGSYDPYSPNGKIGEFLFGNADDDSGSFRSFEIYIGKQQKLHLSTIINQDSMKIV